MAHFIPKLEHHQQWAIAPSTKEMSILEALRDGLNNEYTVFFKPVCGVVVPDIVVTHKKKGLLLIDTTKQLQYVEKQLKSKKMDLLRIGLDGIMPKYAEQGKYYYGITTIPQQDPASVVTEIHGAEAPKDPNTVRDILEAFEKTIRLSLRSKTEQKSQPFRWNNAQKATLDRFQETRRIKVRGSAGSGKTALLCQCAIDAYRKMMQKCKEKKGRFQPVLITYYNITLHSALSKTLFQDLLKRPENQDIQCSSSHIQILHYHQLIARNVEKKRPVFQDMLEALYPKAQPTQDEFVALIQQYEQAMQDYDHYCKQMASDPLLWEERPMQTYGGIIVDEVQDFEPSWLKVLSDVFLHDSNDGYWAVFGDEKQNVYNRTMGEDKLPRVPMLPGAWRTLRQSYRITPHIDAVANRIIQLAVQDKYANDEDANISQQSMMTNDSFSGAEKVRWKFSSSDNETRDYILNIIIPQRMKQQSADIAVLFSSRLRCIDFEKQCREKKHNTVMPFPTREALNALASKKVQVLEKHIKKQIASIMSDIVMSNNQENSSQASDFIIRRINDVKNYLQVFFSKEEVDAFFTDLLQKIDEEKKHLKNNDKQSNDKLAKEVSWKCQHVSRRIEYFFAKILLEDCRAYEKYSKLHFKTDSALIKVSTVESFKGLQSKHVIVVVDDSTNEKTAEHLYTAITRASKSVTIIRQVSSKNKAPEGSWLHTLYNEKSEHIIQDAL